MTTFTVADTAPTLTGTVSASLVGATVVVHIKRPRPLTVLSKTATVTDAAAGAWSVAFATGDLAQAGLHYVEVEVTFSNGKVETFALTGAEKANTFKVRDQIA